LEHGASAASGIVSDQTAGTFNLGSANQAGNYSISRAFLPFDTSSLPDNATITTAKLTMYVDAIQDTNDDGKDWISVIQTSPASSTTLARPILVKPAQL